MEFTRKSFEKIEKTATGIFVFNIMSAENRDPDETT